MINIIVTNIQWISKKFKIYLKLITCCLNPILSLLSFRVELDKHERGTKKAALPIIISTSSITLAQMDFPGLQNWTMVTNQWAKTGYELLPTFQTGWCQLKCIINAYNLLNYFIINWDECWNKTFFKSCLTHIVGEERRIFFPPIV